MEISSRISIVTIPLMNGLRFTGPSFLNGPQRGQMTKTTKVCTNSYLHGDYGFALEGEILDGPSVPRRRHATV